MGVFRVLVIAMWIPDWPGQGGDARRARLNERADELVALGATRLYELEEPR